MDKVNHSRLHLGAKGNTFSKAMSLRDESTKAEIKLWNALRDNRLNGYKFRRQHPIKNYIADFYCHEARLIVEVDGEIHNIESVKEHDEGRTVELGEFDVNVIRFSNEEILNSLENVLFQINNVIEQFNAEKSMLTSPPAPSPDRRGERSTS